MESIKLIFFYSIILLLVLPSSSFADKDSMILTESKLGFKEGKYSYFVGQPINTVLNSFGPAEIVEPYLYEGLLATLFTEEEYASHYLAYTTTHSYSNDGIAILESKDGVIKGMAFYFNSSKTMKPAKIKTDKGIGRGSSLRQISKKYGKPYNKTHQDSTTTNVYYKYGKHVLSFKFKNGILESIGMNAEYLSRLE